MLKFVCPGCGAKLKSEQSISGKTIRCPQCKTKTTVTEAPASDPVAYALEAITTGAPASPPTRPTVPPIPDAKPEVFDISGKESVYRQNPPPSIGKRFGRLVGRHPVLSVVFASISSVFIALGLFAGWTSYTSRIQHNAMVKAIEDKAREKEIAAAKAEEDARKETEHERIHYSVAELPSVVESLYHFHVIQVLEKQKPIGLKIRDVEVNRVSDPRMIDWLWRVSGNVAYEASVGEGQAPGRVAFKWTSLLLFTPDNEVDECWRELVGIESGKRMWRRIGRSCWQKGFRDEVRDKWLAEMKEYDEKYKSRTREAIAQREYIFNSRREVLSEGHGISEEEFSDLLRTID